MLAGRDPGRLAALAARLGGLETAVADVTVPGSVRALLGAGDVLVTTVGQFLSLGAAAVKAALDPGAVYLDCAPEPPFVRRVFEEFGPRARSTALLPAFGHDYVAGTLAAATALAEAGPDAHSVRVGYALLTSAAQGSSRATLVATEGVLRPPGFAFTRGRLKRQAPSGRDWRFTAGGRERRGRSVGGAEPLTLPALAPGLQEVGVYLDWVWQLNPLATLMGSMSP